MDTKVQAWIDYSNSDIEVADILRSTSQCLHADRRTVAGGFRQPHTPRNQRAENMAGEVLPHLAHHIPAKVRAGVEHREDSAGNL